MEQKSVIKKILGNREALLAVILILLLIIVQMSNSSFLTPSSLQQLIKNNAVTMIMALGMLCVMLTGGINCVLWIVLICYVVFFVFMKWSPLGRKIYAVGSNPEAAEVSGINVKNIRLLVYTIMGVFAGLGGALQVGIYASAMPNMQKGGEMDVIAACVIGGVSMSGGKGSVVGTLLGSLILATIVKALPLLGIDSLAQNMFKGILILAVVVVNVVMQRSADRNVLKGREM